MVVAAVVLLLAAMNDALQPRPQAHLVFQHCLLSWPLAPEALRQTHTTTHISTKKDPVAVHAWYSSILMQTQAVGQHCASVIQAGRVTAVATATGRAPRLLLALPGQTAPRRPAHTRLQGSAAAHKRQHMAAQDNHTPLALRSCSQGMQAWQRGCGIPVGPPCSSTGYGAGSFPPASSHTAT